METLTIYDHHNYDSVQIIIPKPVRDMFKSGRVIATQTLEGIKIREALITDASPGKAIAARGHISIRLKDGKDWIGQRPYEIIGDDLYIYLKEK